MCFLGLVASYDARSGRASLREDSNAEGTMALGVFGGQIITRCQAWLAASLVLAGAGCAELPRQATSLPDHVSVTPRASTLDVDAELPKCQARVRFSGKPRLPTSEEYSGFSTQPGMKIAKWEVDGLVHERYRLKEGAFCICNDTMVLTQRELYEAGLSFPAPAGSRAAAEKDEPVPNSQFRRRMIMSLPVANEYCIVMIGVTYFGEFPPEAASFLATFRHVSPAAKASDGSQSGSGPKASATARLSELKELLDRGLITKAEYDQKRKAILDGL